MIRTIVIPQGQTLSFDIPEEYIGKEIEVIAFAKVEVKFEEQVPQKRVSFTALNVDTKEYKFNRDEANKR